MISPQNQDEHLNKIPVVTILRFPIIWYVDGSTYVKVAN